MYNPQRFKSNDVEKAFELMDRNPFATVISVFEGKPFISHLPLTPKKNNDEIEIYGHLARANPHSKRLANSETTLIFHGPHTYVTPSWYTQNNVPTWNYITVHVTGKIELIENEEGIVNCLKELTLHAERHWPSGWEFYIPDDLAGDNLAKNIVGFRLKVQEINFKKKLSQSLNPADRAGVLKGLETRTDDNSRAVLTEMHEMYSSKK